MKLEKLPDEKKKTIKLIVIGFFLFFLGASLGVIGCRIRYIKKYTLESESTGNQFNESTERSDTITGGIDKTTKGLGEINTGLEEVGDKIQDGINGLGEAAKRSDTITGGIGKTGEGLSGVNKSIEDSKEAVSGIREDIERLLGEG